MTRITDFALSHRLAVPLAWLALALVGFATLSSSTGALSRGYALPGYAGYEANQAIARAYGNGGQVQPLVAVLHARDGASLAAPAAVSDLRAALARVAQAAPSARIVSYASTHDRAFLSADGRTGFALVFPRAAGPGDPAAAPGTLDRVRAALAGARVGGGPVLVTGAAALGADNGKTQGLGVMAETMIGVLGALAVLVFVFGSLLALVPLLVALVSVPTTFLLVGGIAHATDVSFIVQYFVALIGLGVAIDYALLVVSRWREERAAGAANDDAVRAAMASAGRAVVLSGTTVAIGLFALVALPVPFLRSIGFAGLLIPLVSVAAATTLLPVVLAAAGPRLDRRRLRRGDATAGWTRWAAFVVRRRWLALAAGLAALVALLVPAFSLQLGTARADSLASGGPARDALATLERSGIGAGALSPFEVLTPAQAAPRVAAALGRVDGVRGAVAPAAWRRGANAIVEVVPTADPATGAGRATLDRVRDVAAGLPARVGGAAPAMRDFVSAVYGSFPAMLALIALVTYVLLARAFRSLVLPLKALALNVLSIGAAWGVLVLVWQQGHGAGALWGLDPMHALNAWDPLMVFAFLYGLSMDYEVFVLSRMREEWDRTGSTSQAVVGGLGRTGRLVTSAALILFLAFVAMGSAPEADTKVLATGFAAGILIDATVVRSLLVPALVAVLGRRNWWLPSLDTKGEPMSRAMLAGAVALVAAPALAIVSALVQPTFSEDAADQVAAFADHRGAAIAALAISLVALGLLIAGVVWLAVVAFPRAPRLALWGGVLGVLGFLLILVANSVGIAGAGIVAALDPAQATAVLDKVNGGVVEALDPLSLVGEIGCAILAYAVRRAGVPTWAAAAIAVGGFVETAGFASATRALVIVGFAVLLVGAVRAVAAVFGPERAPVAEVAAAR